MAHPLLDQQRRQASRYRVTPSPTGRFRLWRFSPWSHPLGGWRLLVDDLRTREDAELHMLSRFGLMEGKPPAPLAPKPAVTVSEAEWF